MKYLVFITLAVLLIMSCAWFPGADDNPVPTPTPTPTPPPASRDDFVDIFYVADLPSTHPNVIHTPKFKAVAADVSDEQTRGFLVYGQYVKNYPQRRFRAYFSVWIDNNSADEKLIAILDVFNATTGHTIAGIALNRQDFPVVNDYTLFAVDFIPPPDAVLEFRIMYLGWAYLQADKIAVVDPNVVTLNSPDQIPAISSEDKDETTDTGENPPGPDVEPTTPPDPEPTPDESYCQESDLLCLSTMTQNTVVAFHGVNYGGAFRNGTFTPTETGGLAFPLTLNAGTSFVVEFELEGNIPHWDKGEHDGGKPSLFTIAETNGTYYLNLQRMYYGYRGSGVFRVILGDRTELKGNAAFLPTVDGFGAYSMVDWGDEAHVFQVHVTGNQCQLHIDDDYTSSTASAPYRIMGTRQVTLMLGNRELTKQSLGQGALTRFRSLRMYYE